MSMKSARHTRSNVRHIDRRRDDLNRCLDAIRAMVDMVGVTDDYQLFNPFTGENLAEPDSPESTFFGALFVGEPEEIVAEVAKWHYITRPKCDRLITPAIGNGVF